MTDALGHLTAQWLDALAAELPGAHELRRELHQAPEVSGKETATAKRVAAAMGVAITPVAETGGYGRLGPRTGPSVGLRGELDALPVVEKTGLEWASTNGAMHACGHDVHLAALTAVVRAARDLDLPYALVPLLQPREEAYPSGARDIEAAGVLTSQQVAHVIGAHVHPDVALGAVATGAGFVNAEAGELDIEVSGQGGHGAYPHAGADVAAAVAQIVTGLPEMLRRVVDPMEPVVISVGTIQVGNGAANVLPDHGRILATIRTTGPETTERLVEAISRFVAAQAAAYDCTGTLTHTLGEPALINDDELVEVLDAELEQAGLRPTEPMRSLGADDFSFFSEVVPSVMCFVGVHSAGKQSLHDATFLPDDGALERVARTFIAGYIAACRRLDAAEGQSD